MSDWGFLHEARNFELQSGEVQRYVLSLSVETLVQNVGDEGSKLNFAFRSIWGLDLLGAAMAGRRRLKELFQKQLGVWRFELEGINIGNIGVKSMSGM